MGMYCSKCGSLIIDGGKYCPKCGASVFTESAGGVETVENETERLNKEVIHSPKPVNDPYKMVFMGVVVFAALAAVLLIAWFYHSGNDNVNAEKTEADGSAEEMEAIPSESISEDVLQQATEEKSVSNETYGKGTDSTNEQALSDNGDNYEAEPEDYEYAYDEKTIVEDLIETARTRELTYADLRGYTSFELSAARNGIYARYGYVFQTKEWNDYFSTFPWYIQDPGFDQNDITLMEKKNAGFIREFEEEVYGGIFSF